MEDCAQCSSAVLRRPDHPELNTITAHTRSSGQGPSRPRSRGDPIGQDRVARFDADLLYRLRRCPVGAQIIRRGCVGAGSCALGRAGCSRRTDSPTSRRRQPARTRWGLISSPTAIL
jgi:hypothetical protein